MYVYAGTLCFVEEEYVAASAKVKQEGVQQKIFACFIRQRTQSLHPNALAAMQTHLNPPIMLSVCVVCARQHCHLRMSRSPLTVCFPASRCRLCASGRSRLDAPVIWRKLLPSDSASCRLSSAMVSWIISRLVV